jgi:hypothetical protein
MLDVQNGLDTNHQPAEFPFEHHPEVKEPIKAVDPDTGFHVPKSPLESLVPTSNSPYGPHSRPPVTPAIPEPCPGPWRHRGDKISTFLSQEAFTPEEKPFMKQNTLNS